MNIQFIILLYALIITGGYCKNARIIAGNLVEIEEYPFVAQLKYYLYDQFFCAGTIISAKHVLTAAHCVYDKLENFSGIRVVTGTSVLNGVRRSIFSLRRIAVHPDFEDEAVGNNYLQSDVAVLTLIRNITFNEMQTNIELPTEDIVPGSNVTLLGWGVTTSLPSTYSPQLRKATVLVLNTTQCAEIFPFYVHENYLCTFSTRKRVSTGDSGGPVVFNNKVVGIISFSIPGMYVPDIQTNVFKYLEFIRRVLLPNSQYQF